MAQRFENLSEEQQQRIRDRIHLQSIVEEVVDLEYQAYYLHTTSDELEETLLNQIPIDSI
jgi:hypothetical protein